MKVIVTGSSKGIGREIAQLFLEKGHIVIGIDKEGASIENVNYQHIQTDIYQGTLPEIVDCEILINNAGVQNENDIDINLKGTMRITEKYAFQSKIKSVLFIASASAQTGAEFPEYVASKGGMVAYMKNVAIRLAPFAATSNSLSPGGVITDLNAHILNSPDLYNQVLNETLLKRWAKAREIAEWAYFVTVINQSMTAQDILIDNGEAAQFNFIW
ncbi:MAG: SDR family oxidoreductase [Prevotella sp.]|nr:SDR family oxidoreductase [Staphylococcus sp.]MCM1349848.1 SDR family oxidoreductase [Prevotella sp.]